MTEIKLKLKLLVAKEHETQGFHWEELGIHQDGHIPTYVVVFRGRSPGQAIWDALANSPAGKALGPAPIVQLRPGEEFEIWKVEP